MTVTAYSPEIAWFLRSSDAALGARSIQANFESAMERQSVSAGGLPNTDLYNDEQVGWGVNGGHDRGSVARARNLTRVWRVLPQWAQAVLLARYVGDPGRWCKDELTASRMRSALAQSGEASVNLESTQLCGVLILLAWRVGLLHRVIKWFQGDKPKRGYPPHYLKACNRVSERAHQAWQIAYRQQTPELMAFKQRLERAVSVAPAFSAEFVGSVDVKL